MAGGALAIADRFVGNPPRAVGYDVMAFSAHFRAWGQQHGGVVSTMGIVAIQAGTIGSRFMEAATFGKDIDTFMAANAQFFARSFQQSIVIGFVSFMALEAFPLGNNFMGVRCGQSQPNLGMATQAKFAGINGQQTWLVGTVGLVTFSTIAFYDWGMGRSRCLVVHIQVIMTFKAQGALVADQHGWIFGTMDPVAGGTVAICNGFVDQ